MNCFYLITNSVKDKDLELTNQIAEYLRGHGGVCVVQVQNPEKSEWAYHFMDVSQLPEDVDCIIVLGGDGTLLRAARDVVDRQIPLCGINLGNMGYLAEIDVHSIYPALDCLLKEEYGVEKRMMLTGSFTRGEQVLEQNIALNDVVISRKGATRVAHFNIYVNDEFLNAYEADGVIISTPTGSTGYSLSAGGPIVSPSASMLLVTPLAAHTLNSRSIVFSDQDKITIEIGKRKGGEEEQAIASFDGASLIDLVTGDKIVITKSKKDTRIVKISNISFLEVLRKKMQ